MIHVRTNADDNILQLTWTHAATSPLDLHLSIPSNTPPTTSEMYFSRLNFLISFNSCCAESAAREALHFLMNAVFFLMLLSRFLYCDGSTNKSAHQLPNASMPLHTAFASLPCQAIGFSEIRFGSHG